MPSVNVKLSGGEYQVKIEPGLLKRLGEELRALSKSARVAVVTDTHVAEAQLPRVEESLRSAGFEVISATIPAGEQHKTIAMILPLYDRFLSARIERSMPVVALGGGVIGDMTGFFAATVL